MCCCCFCCAAASFLVRTLFRGPTRTLLVRTLFWRAWVGGGLVADKAEGFRHVHALAFFVFHLNCNYLTGASPSRKQCSPHYSIRPVHIKQDTLRSCASASQRLPLRGSAHVVGWVQCFHCCAELQHELLYNAGTMMLSLQSRHVHASLPFFFFASFANLRKGGNSPNAGATGSWGN